MIDKKLFISILKTYLKFNLTAVKLQIIGVKQLYKQLKQISQATLQGQSFLVVKNSKPVFRIEPIETAQQKKYTLEDFKKIQFKMKDNDRHLSKNIDKIVYGV